MIVWTVYYTDECGITKVYCYCNTLEGAQKRYTELLCSKYTNIEIKKEIWSEAL